jgi:hypothetical protein
MVKSHIAEPVPTPNLEYNNNSYQSYVENGFVDKIPHNVCAPNYRIKKFLSRAKEVERSVSIIAIINTLEIYSI